MESWPRKENCDHGRTKHELAMGEEMCVILATKRALWSWDKEI